MVTIIGLRGVPIIFKVCDLLATAAGITNGTTGCQYTSSPALTVLNLKKLGFWYCRYRELESIRFFQLES